MLDPRSLADRRDEIARSCELRGVRADVDAAVAAYTALTAKQTELNEANRRRNEHQAAGKKKLSDEEREAHTNEGRALKEAVSRIEAAVNAARETVDAALATLPNFIHPEVPAGGEDDFNELSRSGTPTAFDFAPKDHLGVSEALDLIDFESGAKVAGQKWYYLKNEAVLLELALQRFALDVVLAEGFTPFVTPDVARASVVEGVGFNPRGEETQIYSIANSDLCLVGTAEITLGGLVADTILDEEELPLKMAGISHCFRTEAGAAGRESKGLYRVHQFTKVEMFAVTRPEDSEAMHRELLAIEERIFQGLELPYRVIDIAAGDLGAPAFRKYDIEAWMPGRGDEGSYGEVSSTSNCTDYQSRRLKTRFRRKGSKKNELVHMLNGTAVANSRAIVALLENHQQADGSVLVPKALQPYVGRERIGPAERVSGADAETPALVLGTAGHIDHGKTTLIQALTGVDTDRLPEEKSRGITIELGFAPLDLGEGTHFGVVDVPGHEGLVRTMVAGATGIDVVLLVVAADEGAMPQTREHLAICSLLGLEIGVVALTKSDLVDAEMRELATLDVRELLEGSVLAEAPIVPVSSTSGDGIDLLRAALHEAAVRARSRSRRSGPPRLWTDRCFEMKGFGPVVTGTLAGGPFTVGDQLSIHPTGRDARIRGLQSFGAAQERVPPGARCAVNLQGLSLAELGRGLLLAPVDTMAPTDRFDAKLQWLEGAPPLDDEPTAVELLAGTASARARVALIGAVSLEAGGDALARVHIDDTRLALLPGDRFVVRGFARQGPTGATWGGGTVIDAFPPRSRRSDRAVAARLERLIDDATPERAVLERLERAAHAGTSVSALVPETGLSQDAVRAALAAAAGAGALDCGRDQWLAEASVERLEAMLLDALARYHDADPLAPGMPKRSLAGALPENAPAGAFEAILAQLAARERVAIDEASVRLPEFAPQMSETERALAERLERDAAEAALEPPTLRDWAARIGEEEAALRRLLTHLVQRGTLVHAPGDFFFDRATVDGLRERVVERLRSDGELGTADYKELIGTTRKYAVPLMELFDAEQLTVRKGEVRVLRRSGA